MTDPVLSRLPWTDGSEDYWQVAVWWPGEGYGGSSWFSTKELALADIAEKLRCGYKEVHLRHVVAQVSGTKVWR
jgi:hypothetical protein